MHRHSTIRGAVPIACARRHRFALRVDSLDGGAAVGGWRGEELDDPGLIFDNHVREVGLLAQGPVLLVT
jgi:hypothetical protein